MRKLQFVFMALAALCFAMPVFADTGTAAASLVPIGAGLGMGLAAGLCGMGQGTRRCLGNRGAGPQSWDPWRHHAVPGAWPGLHRVAHPLHPGHRLRQDVVDAQQRIGGPALMLGTAILSDSNLLS